MTIYIEILITIVIIVKLLQHSFFSMLPRVTLAYLSTL